ncbi:MAG: hypothetical protein JW944_11360, partial [Deltaproteobacteria bacterium]|nr:hypothetical protein [Deltaproteobacteria bacterium]
NDLKRNAGYRNLKTGHRSPFQDSALWNSFYIDLNHGEDFYLLIFNKEKISHCRMCSVSLKMCNHG